MKINKLEKLHHCLLNNTVWDVQYKTYPIRERKNKNFKFVEINKKQISLATIEKKYLIKDFDTVRVLYMTEWFKTHPCPAIEYYVIRKDKPELTRKKYMEWKKIVGTGKINA